MTATRAPSSLLTSLVVSSRYVPVYIAIALSGAGALGAQVVWTRLMGML